MLMPKSKKFNARQTEDAKQRFSIRKYSFGATSVLLGFSFMLMGAGSVSAETTTPAKNSTELVVDTTKNSESQQAANTADEGSTKNDTATTTVAATSKQENATTNNDVSQTNSADTQTAENTVTTGDGATDVKENAKSSLNTASNESGQAESTEPVNAATDKQTVAEENPSGDAAEKSTDAAAATADETEKASTQAKPAVTESAAKATAASTSGRLVQGKSLTLSNNEIGYTSSTTESGGAKSYITATISFTGDVGDKFVLKAPANISGKKMSVLYGVDSYTKLSIAETNVTQNNTDGYFYLTTILKESGSLTQNITFTSLTSRIDTIGDNMVDSDSIGSREMQMILSAEDASGSDLGSVSETFTQIMKPTINPELNRQPEKRYQPSVLSNKDYTYSLSLNEMLGINNESTASNYANNASNRVIRNINYDTVIRIPVPAQFELNTTDTAVKNAFNDQTTITQDGIGADIVITIPKGSGNKVDSYDARETPYYIIGKYVFDGSVNQTISADSPITITQYLDDDHKKTLTGNHDITWTENVNSEIVKGNVRVSGYGAWTDNELVLKDTADKLVTYSFSNLSGYDLTDATFTIDVPDGFNATGITTPKVDGTNTYSYVLTYANGTSSSGSVSAGEAIKATGDSPIRKAVLKTDVWKAGAKTDDAGIAMDQNTKLQRFTVTGNLSDTYDDGTAVKVGDKFTSNISITSDYINTGSKGVTQTIRPEYMSTFHIYQKDGIGLAGDSQKLTIYSSKDMTRVQNPNLNKPVIYVVLPQYAIYNDTASKFYGDPEVSTFYVNDGANQVVKVDYSQTEYQYNIRNDNYTIVADISDDALPGTYQSHFYVRTTTKMLYMTTYNYNTLYKPEYTEGDSTNVWTKGIPANMFSLTVLTPSEEFTMGAMSQGNLDSSFQNTGKSFSTNSEDMQFKITPKNLTKGDLTNVRIYSNLPTESEVKLTGPVTTTYSNAKIYYSTSLLDLNDDTEESVTWLSEDQVTNWSTIKSIKVQKDALPQSTPSNQFAIVIPAKDVNLTDDIGKTLNLGYKAYADEFVTPIKKSIATSVIILGPVSESRTVTRTINVHLPSGEVQTTKQIATITRTGVIDRTGNTIYTDWSTSSWDEFSNVPEIPGFTPSQKVVTTETVDSTTSDVTIDITYTLNTQKALVNYVDEDKNNELIEDSGDLSGLSKDLIGYSTEDTIKKLEAAGYVFVSSDYPTDAAYDTDDNNDQIYTVVLKHGHQSVDRNQNVKRTVVYEVPGGFDTPESVEETLAFKQTGDQDLVTKEITWNPVDSQSLKTVTSPKIAGLTANKDEVASQEVVPTFDGDKETTVKVIYTANKQKALVNYVDADKNNEVIEDSGDLSGLSKDLIGYSTEDTIKKLEAAGYVFVSSDYPENPVYDTDDNTNQIYTVVLKHQTQERVNTKDAKQTIHYVGTEQQLPDKVQTEKDAFKQVVVVDLVTGKVVEEGPWTGEMPFTKESVPVVNGYHTDKTSVKGMTATLEQPEVEATVVYVPNGRVILVDKNGQQLPGTSSDQYTTDPENPTKVLDVVVPEVNGYQPQTVQVGQKLTPSDPSADTYIVYDVPSQPTVPSEPATPVEPSTPTRPTIPSKPATPVEPSTPAQPIVPSEPATPVEPSTPTRPMVPSKPATPVEPSTPTRPTVPSKPATPAQPTATVKMNVPSSPAMTSQKTSPSKKLSAAELPQTGSNEEQSNKMTLMGAIILALSATMAFVTGKKRKK